MMTAFFHSDPTSNLSNPRQDTCTSFAQMKTKKETGDVNCDYNFRLQKINFLPESVAYTSKIAVNFHIVLLQTEQKEN